MSGAVLPGRPGTRLLTRLEERLDQISGQLILPGRGRDPEQCVERLADIVAGAATQVERETPEPYPVPGGQPARLQGADQFVPPARRVIAPVRQAGRA